MRFKWDPAKNIANQRKHHVSFETAQAVFEDPLHKSILDQVIEGEQRWLTLGSAGGLVLLVVAHTYREVGEEEAVRIISARKATKRERRDYESL